MLRGVKELKITARRIVGALFIAGGIYGVYVWFRGEEAERKDIWCESIYL